MFYNIFVRGSLYTGEKPVGYNVKLIPIFVNYII